MWGKQQPDPSTNPAATGGGGPGAEGNKKKKKFRSADVVSLGTVVYDRPHYHTAHNIWPVGFHSRKTFLSARYGAPHTTTYHSLIMDGGERPRFCVEAEDDPGTMYEGTSPSVRDLSLFRAWV